MLIVYPAIFHKDEDCYWVEFPDLEGCHTFGTTLKETLENAKEALEGYCITVLESGQTLPAPSEFTKIERTDDDSFVSFVDCKLTNTKNRAVKKTLTIPDWLDKMAVEKNINFSQVLQKALAEELGVNPIQP